jgi:hypothetical protein
VIEETIVFGGEETGSSKGRGRTFLKFIIVPVALWVVLSFAISSDFLHSKLLLIVEKNWKGSVSLGKIGLHIPFTVRVDSLNLKDPAGKVTWLEIKGLRIFPRWSALFSRPVSVLIDSLYLKTEVEGNGVILPFDKYCMAPAGSGARTDDNYLKSLGCVRYGNIPRSEESSEFYNMYRYIPLSTFNILDGKVDLDINLSNADRWSNTWNGLKVSYDSLGEDSNPLLLLSLQSESFGELNGRVNITPDYDRKKLLWNGKLNLSDVELENLHSMLKSDFAELISGASGKASLVGIFNGIDNLPEQVHMILSLEDTLIPLPLGAISSDKLSCSVVYEVQSNKFVNVLTVSGLNQSIGKLNLTGSASLKDTSLSIHEILLNVDSARVMGTGTINLPVNGRGPSGWELFFKGENLPLPPADVQRGGEDSSWTIDDKARIESISGALINDVINIQDLFYKGSDIACNFSGALNVQAGGIVNGTLGAKDRSSSSLGLCGFIWSPSVTFKER